MRLGPGSDPTCQTANRLTQRLPFGRWLCGSMQHGGVEEVIQNMSSSSLRGQEELMKLASNPDPASKRMEHVHRSDWWCLITWAFIYLFIYDTHTHTHTGHVNTNSVFHSPGHWCGWMVEEKVFDTAQRGFQIPVTHLSRYFNKHFFFFSPHVRH